MSHTIGTEIYVCDLYILPLSNNATSTDNKLMSNNTTVNNTRWQDVLTQGSLSTAYIGGGMDFL